MAPSGKRHREAPPARRLRQPGGALTEEMVIALLLGGRHLPLRRAGMPPRAHARHAASRPDAEAWARFHSALAAGG